MYAMQLSSVRPVAARFQAKRTPAAKRTAVVTRAAAAPKEVRMNAPVAQHPRRATG
jgi:hypothetical protein